MLQAQLEIEKALQDDPSVYEYDAIYDDMQQKKIEQSTHLTSTADKKVTVTNIGGAVGTSHRMALTSAIE